MCIRDRLYSYEFRSDRAFAFTIGCNWRNSGDGSALERALSKGHFDLGLVHIVNCSMRVSRFRSHRSLWLMAFDAGCISLAYVFFALPRYNVGLTQEIWFRIAVVACAAIVLQPVSYTHLRAHETDSYLVCRLLLEKKHK